MAAVVPQNSRRVILPGDESPFWSTKPAFAGSHSIELEPAQAGFVVQTGVSTPVAILSFFICYASTLSIESGLTPSRRIRLQTA
jgi:hypothetical protein